jgi:hypothetical protein
MRTKHFWIEIVALGSMIACALALLIATLGAGAAALGGQEASGQAVDPASPSPASSSSSSASRSSSIASPTSSIASSSSSTPARQQTREGMVTDSHCGAKHSADMGKTAGDCVRQCVHGGAGFALVDGDKTYQLDGDLSLLKSVAGQRTRIRGVVRGNIIKVSSIGAAS